MNECKYRSGVTLDDFTIKCQIFKGNVKLSSHMSKVYNLRHIQYHEQRDVSLTNIRVNSRHILLITGIIVVPLSFFTRNHEVVMAPTTPPSCWCSFLEALQ